MLARIGLKADLATGGIEALQYLAHRAYDVVLLDLETPGLDGLEFTRIVRDSWTPAEQPNIVALATYSLEHSKEACLRAGMNGFLRKPLIEQELKAAILGHHCHQGPL
jgi:CheY-like chemotaxis protein